MSVSTQVIFLIVSLGFLIYGVLGMFRYFYAKKHWINTTGTVIQFNKDFSTSYKATTYTAVVAYTTIDGEKIATEADFGTSYKVYEVGQEINIYYNPDKKTDFIIKGKSELIISSIFLAVGIGLTVIHILTLLQNPKF